MMVYYNNICKCLEWRLNLHGQKLRNQNCYAMRTFPNVF
jgi:hypothetical protein